LTSPPLTFLPSILRHPWVRLISLKNWGQGSTRYFLNLVGIGLKQINEINQANSKKVQTRQLPQNMKNHVALNEIKASLPLL